jgi:glucose/arabinose dehydrogenase/mono/diheme cytochrome c family protein
MNYRNAGGCLILPTLAAAAIVVAMPWAIGHAQTNSGQMGTTATGGAMTGGAACANDAGITVPPGFCATVFADKLGHPRQMVVAPDGVLYVNTWSGRYYQNDTPPPGGFLIALKDTHGDGHADVVQRFGETPATGGHGGTGIALYSNSLYAEINDRVVRYALSSGEIAPQGQPTTIITGLPVSGDHPMHPMIIDSAGHLYIDLGSATNACQDANRIPHSPGIQPCTELATRAGTWRYDANKTDQHFSPAERYVTGLRNGEGFAFDEQGRLIATQHGRDQLFENWPNLYTSEQGQNLPAEQLVVEHQGDDFGWPECYFDGYQQKLVLAPEYGGDGKKVGVCAQKQAPIAFFPAHWAPNDMKIYAATQFPHGYRGGAFIAFHGSWNRAPGPQGGYNVVFQPLADGKASGHWVVFADGFAGPHEDPGGALHRPTGLAFAPDGSLYISDDKGGRIWHVTYHGSPDATVVAAAAPTGQSAAASPDVLPPEGIHPNAGNQLADLQPPPGVTRSQLARGQQIFQGQVDSATCAGCHGMDGTGTPMGADLTSEKYLWGDGSLRSITHIIMTGVPHPKAHSGVMPPDGGVSLSQADNADVAAYVWSLSHHRQASATK